MRNPAPLWLLAGTMVLGLPVLDVLAAPGTLDPSFGNNGWVTTFFPGTTSSEQAHGLALQPDGKMIAVGTADTGMGAARYLPDGLPDPSFGYQGKAYDPRLRETSAVPSKRTAKS